MIDEYLDKSGVDSLITAINSKTSNTGTITSVVMNGNTIASSGTADLGAVAVSVSMNRNTYDVDRSGVIDLGTVITEETKLSKGVPTGNGNGVTDISVSGHQITLSKTTFLTSETSLSKGTTTGNGNAVTDISVSGHQITLTKGATYVTASAIENLDKIPLTALQVSNGSVTLEPYQMYQLTSMSGAVTVNFNTSNEVTGFCPEYAMTFTAGSNLTVTLPSTVKYANGVTPTYTQGRKYEIDVINGLAVVGEFY